MCTRDQGLGGRFYPGVRLDQVGTEAVFLLALALLNQHNPYHEAGLWFPREHLFHNAQLLLSFHVFPDPLPLLKAIAYGALPDGRIIPNLEAEGKLLHQANSVPKDQSAFQRQQVAVVRSPLLLRYYAKIQVFKLPIPEVVGVLVPVIPPEPKLHQPLLPLSLLFLNPGPHLLPMDDACQTPGQLCGPSVKDAGPVLPGPQRHWW